MSRPLTPAGALAVALAVVVGTAAAALAIPGRPGPSTLAALVVLGLIWLAAGVVCALLALHHGRLDDYQRLHAAGRPLYRRGEPAALLDIPEAHR